MPACGDRFAALTRWWCCAGFFSQFGRVSKVRVSRNKKTGAAKHYAFLEFASPEVAAIAAEAMDGYMLFTQARDTVNRWPVAWPSCRHCCQRAEVAAWRKQFWNALQFVHKTSGWQRLGALAREARRFMA